MREPLGKEKGKVLWRSIEQHQDKREDSRHTRQEAAFTYRGIRQGGWRKVFMHRKGKGRSPVMQSERIGRERII